MDEPEDLDRITYRTQVRRRGLKVYLLPEGAEVIGEDGKHHVLDSDQPVELNPKVLIEVPKRIVPPPGVETDSED